MVRVAAAVPLARPKNPRYVSAMRDSYFSKKHGRAFETRLDVLLYAHDGRGLGHVSRAVAVGLALRRNFPLLKVLLVTGSPHVAALLGPGTLDWVKLPAYATSVQGGASAGASGASRFYKSVLGELRAEMLTGLVATLRPRRVLVDHAADGKRGELRAAIETTRNADTQWWLGLRGVVGEDPDVWSGAARELVQGRYTGVLWHGDRAALGGRWPQEITARLGVVPVEVGYTSRLRELRELRSPTGPAPDARPAEVVAALPWSTAGSLGLARALGEAARRLGGGWRIFVPGAELTGFRAAVGAAVEPAGEAWAEALFAARAAVVYGGYNSLADVLAAGVPAVVLDRGMRDGEQAEHLARLGALAPEFFRVLPESADADKLTAALAPLLAGPRPAPPQLRLDGAARTAELLAQGLVGEELPE